MKILIVGCGYLGKALGKNLVESGAEVWGLRRDGLALKSLEMVGIRPLQADLLKSDSLVSLPQTEFVVLSQAPSRPMDNYEKTYYEGTENLIRALHTKKPKKLILISSSRVYGQNSGAWVDEATKPELEDYLSGKVDENAKCLWETERLVLSSLVPAVIFRLAGLYGPKRHRLKPLKEGKIKPLFSSAYTNRIHVEDAVNGIKLLMEKGKPGEIYLGVDDEPATEEVFYSWVYEKLSQPKPPQDLAQSLTSPMSNKRCSNKKIKELGMKFKYPSFREGYRSLFEEVSNRISGDQDIRGQGIRLSGHQVLPDNQIS